MAEETAGGPGKRLMAAREGMEVSTGEIADALNLPVRVIEALEQDDYEKLPPSVFTRGYLRSYPRLLELPVDELLTLYPTVAAVPETALPERSSAIPVDPRLLKMAGAGAVVLAVLITGLFWLLGNGADEGDSVSAAPEVSAPVETGSDGAESDPGRPDSDQTSTEPSPIEQTSIEQTSIEQLAPTDQPEPATALPVEQARPSQEATIQSLPRAVVDPAGSMGGPGGLRITELGNDRLVFTFEEECWVEVKSATGESLYSDLNRAGRTLVLHGQGPFRILLGYAPGVTLEFNGQSVALAPHTRNNVANLVLGE